MGSMVSCAGIVRQNYIKTINMSKKKKNKEEFKQVEIKPKVDIGEKLDSILVEVDPEKEYILFLQENSMTKDNVEGLATHMYKYFPNVRIVCLVRDLEALKLRKNDRKKN